MSVRASVRAHWLAFTRPMEGSIAWLYLDKNGDVTIADGVLVRTAPEVLRLALVHKDGSPAIDQEKLDDWQRVKSAANLANEGWRAAGKVAQLRLTPSTLEAATWQRFDEISRDLVRRFPAFASWPADTQLAVLSMGWALGSGFEGKTHPRCAAAIRAGAWLTAAVESKIADNAPRTIAQRRLFLAGLRVLDDQLNPEQITPASVTLAELEAHYLGGPPAGAGEGPVQGASEAVAVGWQAGVEAERNPER